jgi:hypothetical protein
LEAQKEEAKGNDHKDKAFGDVHSLNVNHLSNDMVPGRCTSEIKKGQAQEHTQKVMNVSKKPLPFLPQAGSDDLDGDMPVSQQEISRAKKGDPEHGVLVELDDPDRGRQSQGPGEDGIADGKSAKEEKRGCHHCQPSAYPVQ